MGRGGFSWKRATGVTRTKQNISRATGVPFTKSGRQRKVGKMTTARGCLLPSLLLSLVVVAGGTVFIAGPSEAMAATCMRVVGGNWNPTGNDNYPPALNAESVKVKNSCGAAQLLTGWRIHDYKAQHTFRFPAGFKIGPGVTVTVYSGRGTRTSTRLYFGFSYGAVWNDSAPERAYLKNAAGTVVSSWSAY